MRTSVAFFMGVLLLAVASGCSLITDFDNDGKPEGDGAPSNPELYAIDENLTQEVVVSLDETDIGTLELALDEPLPNADEGDEELLAMLGSSINVWVKHVEVGTTVDITKGTLVDSTPASPGEYKLSTTPDRKQIDIQFFNEVDGRSLQPHQDYAATIQVIENDYFKTENFARDVSVVR
jgi:hypothetical protein